jgi:hypothetical protein
MTAQASSGKLRRDNDGENKQGHAGGGSDDGDALRSGERRDDVRGFWWENKCVVMNVPRRVLEETSARSRRNISVF